MYYETPTATISCNYWLMPIAVRKKVTAYDVISAACESFKITIQALLSKSRDRGLVRVRNICFYVIKNKLNLSLKEIGKIFNRDHTTVIHGIKYVNDELSLRHTRQQMNEDLRAVMGMCM